MLPALGATRLGFGCAHLPGKLASAETQALVHAAFDAGVRHFDVARMYGDGRAEAIVGAALGARRKDCVIVTKAGISPASPSVAARAWRKAAAKAPLLRSFTPHGVRAWAEPQFGRFAPIQIRDSLEHSLRALGTDYVDALLLHEIAPTHVAEPLREELDALVKAGKILRWGVASDGRTTQAMLNAHPDWCVLTQTEAAAPIARPAGGQLILHSVLGARFYTLAAKLRADPDLALKAGVDRIEDLAGLLLHEAAARADVVLFSSANAERIRRNAAALSAPPPTELTAFQRFLTEQS